MRSSRYSVIGYWKKTLYANIADFFRAYGKKDRGDHLRESALSSP